MPIKILPAIMSGGAGSRLWPESTDARPKQFLSLNAQRTLFQQTAARVTGAAGDLAFLPPIVLCNARHGDLVDAQLAEIGLAASAIVLEPAGRNTAATGAVAAALAREIAPDALVLLLPADHVIADRAGFLATLERAAAHAHERIVLFGIAPSRPETGFGYIEMGDVLSPGVHAVAAFHEKPNLKTAEFYCKTGRCLWNGGVFLFDSALMVREFAHAPAIGDAAMRALAAAERRGVRITLPPSFEGIESLPIDKAVMERTKHAAVAPSDFGWADVGSWAEIWRLSQRDAHGNAVRGDALLHDARNNLIRSDGVTVAIAGVSDLIVVASGGVIVIVPRDRAQDVKLLWELAQGETKG